MPEKVQYFRSGAAENGGDADNRREGGSARQSRTGAAASELFSALADDLRASAGWLAVRFTAAGRVARERGRSLARRLRALLQPPARPPLRQDPARPTARRGLFARGWRALRAVAAATALVALVAAAAMGGAMLWALHSLPLEKGLLASEQSSLLLEAANGRSLGRVGPLTGEVASRQDFPDQLVAAVLSIEDRRFFSHWGIDLRGIARAFHANVSAGDVVEGGSTITQQLAKLQLVGSERTLRRKLREMFTAFWLELRLGKDEILTRYLNSVYLGAGAHGMAAATRMYLDKPMAELTLAEAAMLAGLIKAPSEFNPVRNLGKAQGRASVVLDAMVENGAIEAKTAEQAKAGPATLRLSARTARADTWFPYWIASHEYPKIAGPSARTMRVRTTLHPGVQKAAEEVVASVLSGPAVKHNARQAALVAMRPDGAVLAMVGGRDFDESQFNRAVDAKRQPGSAFKLFVYLAALRQGYSPDDSIDAGPVKIKKWAPENADGQEYGEVTLAEAFARSINTAAVRLAMEVGLDKVVAAARDLGIDAPLAEVPSLALGASEVSLLDLTGAFASVRAGRTRLEPWGIAAFGADDLGLRPLGAPSGQGQPLKFREELTSLLQGVVDRGTGRAAALGGMAAAGKTGTSQDYRDAWFVGFTEKLVVGVWVGNDDRSPMKRVTGGSLPALIWKRFVERATPLVDRLDPPVAATAPDESAAHKLAAASCDRAACARAYSSFRASDCTYQPRRGPRRLCEKGDAPDAVASDRRDRSDRASERADSRSERGEAKLDRNEARPDRGEATDREEQTLFPFGAQASVDDAPSGAPTSALRTMNRAPAQCNYARCGRYRSFDPSDCTYQPYGGGPRILCER